MGLQQQDSGQGQGYAGLRTPRSAGRPRSRLNDAYFGRAAGTAWPHAKQEDPLEGAAAPAGDARLGWCAHLGVVMIRLGLQCTAVACC